MKKLFILLLFITGCAGAWSQVGGSFQPANQAFSVDLPQGWMKFNAYDGLLITRDGIFLQSILIERIHSEQKDFSGRRALKRGMAPLEVAEVMADYLLKRKRIANPSLLEKGPLMINGRPGFKLVYSFKNHDGLTYKGIYCGVMVGNDLLGLRYLAVKRHYFEKDIETFEKVLASFKAG